MELTKGKLELGDLPIQTQCECLKVFNKLVRLIKSSSFSTQVDSIFRFAWANL